MSAYGTIIARVFTSEAIVPLPGAMVSFTKQNAAGERILIALRMTNFDGLTDPVIIETPDFSQSQQYAPDAVPYSTVDVEVEAPDFDRVRVENAQVFADRQTIQRFLLIPTPDLPDSYTRTEIFIIPAHPL